MTETREVDYAKLAARARKLFTAINAQMARIQTDLIQTDEWCELHDLSKYAGGLLSQLNRIEKRERGREEDAPGLTVPVPYWPATPAGDDAPVGDGS